MSTGPGRLKTAAEAGWRPRPGDRVVAVLTGEAGTVASITPEGVAQVAFGDGTRCTLSPSEYRRWRLATDLPSPKAALDATLAAMPDPIGRATITNRTSLNPSEIVDLWQGQAERVEIVTEHAPSPDGGPYTRAAYAEWTWFLTPTMSGWVAARSQLRTRWVTLPELVDVARAELAPFIIDDA